MKGKFNIELSISRSYNKVTISFVDEPIEYLSDEELRAKIRKKFALIKEEINLQFKEINQNGSGN